jgi:FtsP/CotA-like multicopper oxidase with cupredoxin domain
MVVNGKAYPYMNLLAEPQRFRVLNAANDRMLNLQLYYAWEPPAPGGMSPDAAGTKCDGTQDATYPCTEVKMIRADGSVINGFQIEGDTRAGGVPDPALSGPAIIQIGTEGGFLPNAVVVNNPAQPVGYDRDPKSMTVGNVVKSNILLGGAERADIVVDLTGVLPGAKFILYNDAPAALPAGDKRYDLYTGNEDLTAMGGAPPTVVGKGPNTRTIMQFRVVADNTNGLAPNATARAGYSQAALEAAIPQAFAAGQDAPLVPQTFYNAAYPAKQVSTNNFGTLFNNTSLTITKADGTTETLPIFQKAIAEEFDVAYGRMSAVLGTEAMIMGNQGQNTFGFTFVDPATEKLPAGVTQIWKITHNGVDTHAIHFHLLNVQVINRVDWAGVIKAPDDNELGWKETVRMNPLEDIILAVRAKVPPLPPTWAALGGVPDSVRPKDPTQPLGSMMNFTQPWPYVHDNPKTQPSEFNVDDPNPTNTMNELTNFGWEYTWHCHILGHEENDMMRPLVLTSAGAIVNDTQAPKVTAAQSPAANAAGWNRTNVTVTVTAVDVGTAGVQSITINGVVQPGSNTGTASYVVTTATQGITKVTYSAKDNNNNVSPTATYSVKIDSVPLAWAPATSKLPSGVPTATVKGTAVTLSGRVVVPPPTSAAQSPIDTTGLYSMTGPSPASGTFTLKADGTFSFGRTKLPAGTYAVTLTVKDQAGNPLVASLSFVIK